MNVEYKKINCWTLLKSEDDQPMLQFAEKNDFSSDKWQNGFFDRIFNHLYKKKSFETAIDIGASYGWVTIPLARKFKNIHSFEVRDDVRSALAKNIENVLSNEKVDSSIHIHNFGLGDSDQKVSVAMNPKSGLSSIKDSSASKFPINQFEIKSLDSINIKKVDLIKIDVEGFEYNVLKGCQKTIKKYRPFLIVEMNTGRSEIEFKNRQKCLEFLFNFGYKVIDVSNNDWFLSA